MTQRHRAADCISPPKEKNEQMFISIDARLHRYARQYFGPLLLISLQMIHSNDGSCSPLLRALNTFDVAGFCYSAHIQRGCIIPSIYTI